MAKKSSNYIACKHGKMKTRCPCVGHGQGSSSSCECVGCQNVYGARSGSSTIPSGVKRKRSPGIYKREKGCKYTFHRLEQHKHRDLGQTMSQFCFLVL